MKENSNNSKFIMPILIIVIGLILLVGLGAVLISKNDERNIDNVTSSKKSSPDSPAAADVIEKDSSSEEKKKLVEMKLSSSDIYSEAAYLIDTDGNVLLDIGSDEKLYPASLTKIMTAVIAIEKIKDLDAAVTIPGYIYDYIIEQQASTAGFAPDETVTYRDLIYGTLLSSGAECCLTLADNVAGSESQYVALMNKKASELGMKDTHFMNVCGLHDSEHYTTAYDISVLLRYALSNEEFKEVFTSTSFDTSTDKRPSGVTLSSTLFSVMDSQEFRGGKIIGGKTGYTDEAGLCLASLAEIDGEEYMLVTMGAKGSHATEPFHIKDAVKIYETLANGGEPLPEEKTEPVEQSSSESSKKDTESSITYDDTHITYDDTYSNIEDYYYSYEESDESEEDFSEEEEVSEEQSPESNSTSSEEETPSPEQQPEAPEMTFDVQ